MVFAQLLCGEKFDHYPTGEENDKNNHSKKFAETLIISNKLTPEARSLLNGLLENDPKERLGSPKSQYGLINDHPFFNKVDWENVKDCVHKSDNQRIPVREK